MFLVPGELLSRNVLCFTPAPCGHRARATIHKSARARNRLERPHASWEAQGAVRPGDHELKSARPVQTCRVFGTRGPVVLPRCSPHEPAQQTPSTLQGGCGKRPLKRHVLVETWSSRIRPRSAGGPVRSLAATRVHAHPRLAPPAAGQRARFCSPFNCLQTIVGCSCLRPSAAWRCTAWWSQGARCSSKCWPSSRRRGGATALPGLGACWVRLGRGVRASGVAPGASDLVRAWVGGRQQLRGLVIQPISAVGPSSRDERESHEAWTSGAPPGPESGFGRRFKGREHVSPCPSRIWGGWTVERFVEFTGHHDPLRGPCRLRCA